MSQKSATILIVDDCRDIAHIIARYLESAGYRTLVATAGLEAERILAAARPACVVLDLMMPGMSGAELLNRLRKDRATADLPVVLVSARVGFHGTHFSAQIDADYSVGKPFTRQQIVRAVETVLARRAGTEPAPRPPRIDAKARLAAELARAAGA